MGMTDWAENEVRIVCDKLRKDTEDRAQDYELGCYESALKAYKSLCEDGHSGLSFSITKSILNRLMNSQPLTPIEDTEDCWQPVGSYDTKRSFQCKRMYSLFKDVCEDGTIKFQDIDRIECVDIGSDLTYHSGLVCNVWDQMFPITLPYYPQSKPTRIYCETFLVDENNGDFDTKGILYAVTPDGEHIDINRYFKQSDSKESYDEIDFLEYVQRKGMKIR